MDHLHAYWRMEYIEAPKSSADPQGIFARLPEMDDQEALIIWRGQYTYLVLNKYPYNAGHLLAVPYAEVAELAALETFARAELLEAIIEGQRILTEALRPDGFNVGFNFGDAAGAGIPKHLHGHIVPRWSGDTNFMPVLGETRVLPLSLDAMWRRLRSFCH